jgi:hypothetical protein
MERTTGQELETLLQRLSPDELQEIPKGNLVPGMLTQVWSLLAGQAEQRNAAELALELSPDYTGPRRLTGAGNPTEAKKREEERQRLQSIRFYEDTMHSVRDRTDILLERIDEQQRLTRKKLQDIEENALHLHDGRAAYVGQKGEYLDGQGRQLQGDDKREADTLHRQNPNASTWSQKDEMQRQYDEQQRLREKVQRLNDDAAADDGAALSDKARADKMKDTQGRLSAVEKEFGEHADVRTAALSSQKEVTDDTYGGSDYMAAYGRNTSYAGSLDNSQNKSLSASFKPAAAGQGTQPGDDPNRVARNNPAPQVPSQ